MIGARAGFDVAIMLEPETPCRGCIGQLVVSHPSFAQLGGNFNLLLRSGDGGKAMRSL